MKTHVSVPVVPGSTAPDPLHLGTYRRNIMAVVADDTLFTAAEQLRANDSVYQCRDVAKLALWLKNVRRVAQERETAHNLAAFGAAVERGEELVKQHAQYATEEQVEEIGRVISLPCILACEKSQVLTKLPALTYGGAVFLLGKLYSKVFYRTGQRLASDGSTQQATR